MRSNGAYENMFRDFAISAAKLSVKTLEFTLLYQQKEFITFFSRVYSSGKQKNPSEIYQSYDKK